MELNYRADIDGLRAIAVLSVVLNHAGIVAFSGGFIGVDIFFVISGYLITSIIGREIQGNQFSLIKFYERRIRRILPALFVVIAFTIVVCALIYDAEKFMAFGKSVMATTLFGSNINFWRESGYFDTPSRLKPLLHTWSLAVEEQFYIVFPLLMAALYRYARKFTPAILMGIAIVSLVLGISAVTNNPSTAFYLAPMRAWELLTGSLLALNIIPKGLGKIQANVIGLAGLIMIAVPIFQYSDNTKFPGISAIPPVLGTAMIIIAGMEGKSLIGRFLGFPLLVFIGKISYSVYLWHWPLIIFARYYSIRQMTSAELGVVLVSTFVISTLSWAFVETPFRSKQFLSTKQIYIFAGSVMTLIFFAGAAITHFKGFPERNGVKYLATASDNKKEEGWLYEECNINYIDNPESIHPCKIGDPSQAATFMIWGDSHAPTYGKAVHISSAINDLSGVLTYTPGCPTLLDMIPEPQNGDTACVDYNRMVLSYLTEHTEIQTVILISRWTVWLEGTRYKQEEGSPVHLVDDLKNADLTLNNEDLFRLGLERTIKTLVEMDRNVILIAPLPEIGYDVPSANFIASRTGRDVNQIIAPSLEEYIARNQRTMTILKSFQEKYGFQIIEPWKFLCQQDICRAVVNGIPLYRDDSHLSIFGSELISPVFDPFFESMKQSSK